MQKRLNEYDRKLSEEQKAKTDEVVETSNKEAPKVKRGGRKQKAKKEELADTESKSVPNNKQEDLAQRKHKGRRNVNRPASSKKRGRKTGLEFRKRETPNGEFEESQF